MTALLDVQVRHKRYGERELLRNLALRVHHGEVVALVGASGCGKSTLLRVAAGLDSAYDGRVLLAGRPVTAPTRDIRFVFQEPRLLPWLTVAANVAFDLGLTPAQAEQDARVRELLADVGLAGFGDRWPKQLSGGQAQRVAIARGLALRPQLLLLDEPFSAVDAFTRLKLQALLLQLVRQHGIAVLLVTHDLDEAVHLADRVCVFDTAPGPLAADLALALPHPRDRDGEASRTAAAAVRRALHAAHVV
jgi:sulfonate transport system ATP-binding protein